jgi:tetratricopeptide (TPR) repeat protein
MVSGMIDAVRSVAVLPTEPVQALEPSSLSIGAQWLFTALGILFAFGLLFVPLTGLSEAIFRQFEIPWLAIHGLEEIALKLFASVAIIALVVRGERRSLRSIGIKPAHFSDLALGIAAFLLAELSMSACESLLPNFRFAAAGRFALFTRWPMWLVVAAALVNGIFEELGAHGFAIERLSEVTGSLFVGALIAFALDVAIHVPYWGWRHTTILAPGLAVFAALYVWRRSLAPCIVAHILSDALPILWRVGWAFAVMFLTPLMSYDSQGSIYYTKGDFDRAIALYNSALAKNPRDVYALQWRGLAWLNKKDYGKSLADLGEAIRIDPRDAESYAHRAFVYRTRGDQQHALADLDQAIALEPDDGSAYEMRARVESSMGDHERARQDYRHAVRLEPSNSDLHSDVAYEAYQLRDFSNAADYYYSAARLDPGSADTWNSLAMAYLGAGKYDEALRAVAHAMKIGAATSEEYQLREKVHIHRRQWELALDDVNRAIGLAPNDAVLYDERGWIHLLDQDDAHAIADFQKSIAIAPDPNDATYNFLAWTLATNPSPRLRDGRRAVDLATRACELSYWSDGIEIDTLAAAYAESGDFARAVEYENKAIALLTSSRAEREDARLRLDLYQQRKPYHEIGRGS